MQTGSGSPAQPPQPAWAGWAGDRAWTTQPPTPGVAGPVGGRRRAGGRKTTTTATSARTPGEGSGSRVQDHLIPGRPDLVASAMIGLMWQFAYEHLAAPAPRVADAEAIDLLTDFILRGIGGR